MNLQRLIFNRIVWTQVEMNEPYVVVLPQVRQLMADARQLQPRAAIEEVFGNQERFGFTTTGAAVSREFRRRQFCNANRNVGNRREAGARLRSYAA